MQDYDNPCWDLSTGMKKKKKRGIIPTIVAYLSLLHWSHGLRSDQCFMPQAMVGLNLAENIMAWKHRFWNIKEKCY